MSGTHHAQHRSQATRDGIYRAIQWLLFLDVVLGLALAVVGAVVLKADSISVVGVGLAVIGMLLMVFFHFVATRDLARAPDDADAPEHRRPDVEGSGSAP